MDEVIPLFPTPVMRSAGVVPRAVVDGLAQHFSGLALQTNNSSANLSHTQMLRPSDSPLLVDVAALVTPKLAEFGALLFGERLGWSIKEMWVNVLDEGGRQAMHNHANSFISGVVYLTPTHPESRTAFMKSSSLTKSLSARMANMPASVHTLRRSAPLKPYDHCLIGRYSGMLL